MQAQTINPATVKAVFNRPPAALKTAAKAVFISMAYTETIRPIIEGIQNEQLAKGNYKYDPHHTFGTRSTKRDIIEWDEKYGMYIKTLKHTYLMSESDFGHYYTECQHKYRNAGFDFPDGQCPLLIAESNEREAKRIFAELCIDALKMPFTISDLICGKLEKYHNFIELNLKMMANHIKPAKQN